MLGNRSRIGLSRVRGPYLHCLWFFGLLALGALGAFACGDPQDVEPLLGSLSGTVRDAETEAPIEGAALVVAGIERRTASDGSYRIDSVPAGFHQVTVARAGYVTQTFGADIQAGDTEEVTVVLARDPDPGPDPDPNALRIRTAALPTATVDLSYDAHLEATGGVPPYRWELLPSSTPSVVLELPPGLTLDADGRVAGTPDFPAGLYQFAVEVSDAEARTDSAEVTLEVMAPSGLRVTSRELTVGIAQQPYADTLEAAGGTPPYTFEWNAFWFVPFERLDLEAATGAISGVASPTGPEGEPVEVRVTVRDLVGASAIGRVRLGILPLPLVIVTDLPDGRIEQPYRVELAAEGGVGGSGTWTITAGALPPGLSLQDGIGALRGVKYVQGTPTEIGRYDFTLQASYEGFVATRAYTVVIGDRPLSIVTSTLPDAQVGAPYSVFLVRAGGTGPFNWDVLSGSLPPGLSLSADGRVSGTATAANQYFFVARVRDGLGQAATASLALLVEP